MSSVTVTIYLDTVHPRKDGTHPVKLRVYYEGERRYYPVRLNQNGSPISLTKEEFRSIYLSKKVRREHVQVNNILRSILTDAEKIAQSIRPFTFDEFALKLTGKAKGGSTLEQYYYRYIEMLNEAGRIGTKENYELSLKSLLKFYRTSVHSGLKSQTIDFKDITKDLLYKYERECTDNGKSPSTIGAYLRPLRAIFNQALEKGDIDKSMYPFGKGKYVIPAARKVKKALNKEDIKKLVYAHCEPESPREKARDFWIFSYVSNGMNVADIANLKYGDITADTIVFIRSKTKNTTKENITPIVVPLHPFAKQVIAKYGKSNAGKDDYVFPIIDKGEAATVKRNKWKAFTRFINQHIKQLAKDNGITSEVSCNWGRHSFTTIAVREGASLEQIRDSLGHTDIKTTMNYFSGFAANTHRETSNKLLDFDENK